MIKAIGKGSLASILAVGLHIVRVIVWIAFAGLSVAVVLLPFLPAAAEWISSMRGVDISGDIDVDGGDYVEILYHFFTMGVALYVVERLLELLKTLRFGSPFVRENATRFRRIGFALLIGEGMKLVAGVAAGVLDADIDIDFEMMSLMSVAAVFVLAEVFREGARMKEEQDLTV